MNSLLLVRGGFWRVLGRILLWWLWVRCCLIWCVKSWWIWSGWGRVKKWDGFCVWRCWRCMMWWFFCRLIFFLCLCLKWMMLSLCEKFLCRIWLCDFNVIFGRLKVLLVWCCVIISLLILLLVKLKLSVWWLMIIFCVWRILLILWWVLCCVNCLWVWSMFLLIN